MDKKKEIIKIFKDNVYGKIPDMTGYNKNHDGKGGHWLEKQFGIKANRDNKADIYGYELKKDTKSKITFGDWSANEYIFWKGKYEHLFNGKLKRDKQNSFVNIFGTPNPDKEDRHSWSGSVCPKVGDYNDFGQKLIIKENKDIEAVYNYEKDNRKDKASIVPNELKNGEIVLATWYGESDRNGNSNKKTLKRKLEDKFKQEGSFICKRDKEGKYSEIWFGGPISFENWIEWVKKGYVIFDSGMYEGNYRPYSSWRASNSFWNSIIDERYTIDDINEILK